jgi:hypothetical protein
MMANAGASSHEPFIYTQLQEGCRALPSAHRGPGGAGLVGKLFGTDTQDHEACTGNIVPLWEHILGLHMVRLDPAMSM